MKDNVSKNMKNKIRRIFLLSFLFFPLISMAQLSTEETKAASPNIDVLAAFLRDFLTWVLGGMGVLSLVGYIIAIIIYIVAAADEDKIALSRWATRLSSWGIVISIVGLTILSFFQDTIPK